MEALHKLLSFTRVMAGLKRLERWRGHLHWRDYPSPDRYESVADHSWRLALLVTLISDELAHPIHLERTLIMALIHDVPEILAGDPSPFGETGVENDGHAFNPAERAVRFAREDKAARELFGTLSTEKEKEIYNLWLEYEQQLTFESQVVKALDKIEAMLQILEYRDGHMFATHLDAVSRYVRQFSHVDPAIAHLGELLEAELRQKFVAFETNQTG